MKNYIFVLAAGIVLMAAAGCCQKCPKVTAVVAGEDNAPVAVVVEYCKAVKVNNFAVMAPCFGQKGPRGHHPTATEARSH